MQPTLCISLCISLRESLLFSLLNMSRPGQCPYLTDVTELSFPSITMPGPKATKEPLTRKPFPEPIRKESAPPQF